MGYQRDPGALGLQLPRQGSLSWPARTHGISASGEWESEGFENSPDLRFGGKTLPVHQDGGLQNSLEGELAAPPSHSQQILTNTTDSCGGSLPGVN